MLERLKAVRTTNKVDYEPFPRITPDMTSPAMVDSINHAQKTLLNNPLF
jgi:hypothetical protein